MKNSRSRVFEFGGAASAAAGRCAPAIRRGLLASFLSASYAASLAAAPAVAGFELPDGVRQQAAALVHEAAAALAPPAARIAATAGELDTRLRLAPCARIEPFLVAGLRPWGATRVGLRCVDGATAWRAFLPVQVQVLAPAWTSKAALPAGALLTAEQWQLAETDWAAGAALPLGAGAAIAGRVLARPVAAGQALRETDLQARRWFGNGQTVRIVAAGAGYSISTEGQALGPGIEGQPVRVRTEGGRVLTGQATGEALVEVRL